MKVSTQPMSAFAVYSEKLKQKKIKSNLQESNRINKSKKVKNPLVCKGINKLIKANEKLTNGTDKLETMEVENSNKPILNKQKKNAEEKARQMKEIGYILQKLTERSVDTSSPRAVALLNSINEANKNLQLEDSACREDSLADLFVVKDKVKASNLKKKKERKNIQSSDASGGKNSNSKSFLLDGFEENHDSHKILEDLETRSSKETKTKKSQRLKIQKVSSKEKPTGLPVSKAKFSEKNKSTKSESRQRIRNKIKTNEINSKWGEERPNYIKLFEWLILPVTEKDFMLNFWEKKPLLIQREGNRRYFSELLCTETIDSMLRENNVCFTKHLDVTSYTDGVRETHNLTGRAQANVVWDFYSNGCSVRLLNPQIFMPKIHALNATLQEYFGCFVGANVYLTPPNSQGFAPHYDDIEAFVLQIEGKKHWKVYSPRNDAEVLPRFSSPNFSQDEVGEPFLDVTLEPGDLLYFPRGFIHQASTVEGEHSLHITLSAYQKTAWVDLFEKVLPIALKKAAESDVDFRRGLPRDYLGLEHHGSPREKQEFVGTAQALMSKLGHYLQTSLGAGVDLMGAQFMHDALPPVLSPDEKKQSSAGAGLKLRNGKLEGRVEFQMDTFVKLIRYNCCRLVVEEEEVRLYHSLDNSLEYHGEEPQFLILPPEGVQVIDFLQKSYPAFRSLQDIPHEDPEALLTLISDLWDAGLLSAKNLPVVEES